MTTRIALTAAGLGLTGLLTLSACGAGPGPAVSAAGGRPAVAAPAAADDFEAALELTGFEGEPAAAPAPSASTAADKKRPHQRAGARRYLRQNTLHGEVTVQGKDGVKTMVVQRGSVTAVDAGSVTVKSTDGFTLTWTLDDKARVRKDKKASTVGEVRTGVQVGLAGQKSGTAPAARLIVVG